MAPPPTYGNLPVVIDPTAWAGRVYSPTIPTTIDQGQTAIAAALTTAFATAGLNIPVYIWPNFDLDTWWNSNPEQLAFVLVSYLGTTFSKPISTSAMLQERTMRFKIHVEARTKNWAAAGAGSIYALIDAIEAILTGDQILGFRKGYFVDEEFSEQKPNGAIWLYDMSYHLITMRVYQLPAMTLANLAQIINNVSPGGDTVIVEADENPPLSG